MNILLPIEAIFTKKKNIVIITQVKNIIIFCDSVVKRMVKVNIEALPKKVRKNY